MIDRTHPLIVNRQAELLNISRGACTTSQTAKHGQPPPLLDNSEPLLTHPIALIYRCMSVQINRTTSVFILGGFKFEAQRALVIDETPLRVF